MSRTPRAPIAVAAAVFACAPIALAGPDCRPSRTGIELPAALDETSGVAVGLRNPGVLWTHNDDGGHLFAIDTAGTEIAWWPVEQRLFDWEDVAAAPCDTDTHCLYLADTGDNGEVREPGTVRVVRVPEPLVEMEPGGGWKTGEPLVGELFPIRLPGGPRDIEALFVLPGERVHLITKGRNHGITVYRYPGVLRPDTVTLMEIQRLTDGPAPLADQVTGASASTDGRWVAVRTYQSVSFFEVTGDTLAPMDDGVVNLRTLRESQGEAVALGPDGMVVLTSEAGLFGGAPGMNLLRCDLVG